jgi:hypothetical protein
VVGEVALHNFAKPGGEVRLQLAANSRRVGIRKLLRTGMSAPRLPLPSGCPVAQF